MPIETRDIIIFEECQHKFHKKCLHGNEKYCLNVICYNFRKLAEKKREIGR